MNPKIVSKMWSWGKVSILHPSGPFPWGPENHENKFENVHKHHTPFEYGFKRHLDGSGEASMLDQNGVDFGPQGAGKQDPANQKQRARF